MVKESNLSAAEYADHLTEQFGFTITKKSVLRACQQGLAGATKASGQWSIKQTGAAEASFLELSPRLRRKVPVSFAVRPRPKPSPAPPQGQRVEAGDLGDAEDGADPPEAGFYILRDLVEFLVDYPLEHREAPGLRLTWITRLLQELSVAVKREQFADPDDESLEVASDRMRDAFEELDSFRVLAGMELKRHGYEMPADAVDWSEPVGAE